MFGVALSQGQEFEQTHVQRTILNWVVTDTGDLTIVKSRQCGITTALLACAAAISMGGSRVVFVNPNSRSNAWCNDRFIKEMSEHETHVSSTKNRVAVLGGGIVDFSQCNDPDIFINKEPSLVIFDEAAFMPNDFWRLYTEAKRLKSRVICASTLSKYKNKFDDLIESSGRAIYVPWFAAPNVTRTQVDNIRQSLSASAFALELECRRI